MRFSHFKFNFLKFQQLRHTYVTYTLCHIFVIVTQWLAQEIVLNNFNKRKYIFPARPSANYIVLNICHRSSIGVFTTNNTR